MSGASLQDIAAVLGHKSLQVTFRYVHLMQSHLGGVLEQMSTQFLQTGQPPDSWQSQGAERSHS